MLIIHVIANSLVHCEVPHRANIGVYLGERVLRVSCLYLGQIVHDFEAQGVT